MKNKYNNVQMVRLLLHAVGVFSEYNESFEVRRERNVFVSCELGSFAIRQKNGRCMSLKAGDCLRLSSLSNNVHCL